MPDLNAQPAKRALSRRFDKERKKLKRAIEREKKRLQKIGLTNAEIAHGNKIIKNMESELAASRYDRKSGYKLDIDSFEANVESFTYVQRGLGAKDNGRIDESRSQKNHFFITQLNNSTRKGGYSTLREEETRLFYQTTIKVWRKDKGSDDKNNAILASSGYNYISTVYDMLIHPENYNTEEGRKAVEDLLKKFKLDTSYNDYLENLNFVKKRFPRMENGDEVKSTDELPSSERERIPSPPYLSVWGSYMESISSGN